MEEIAEETQLGECLTAEKEHSTINVNTVNPTLKELAFHTAKNFDKFKEIVGMTNSPNKAQPLPNIQKFPTIKGIIGHKNQSTIGKIEDSKLENNLSTIKHEDTSSKNIFNQQKFIEVHNRNLDYLRKITIKHTGNNESIGTQQAKEKIETPMDRFNKIKKHFRLEITEACKEKAKIFVTPPVLNDNFYSYCIIPGNNSETIRKCLRQRLRWKEGSTFKEAQLMWSPESKSISFSRLDKSKSQVQSANHFEYHKNISNKLYLFHNLMQYCETKSLDVFAYMPITIYIQYENVNYLKQFSSFTQMFSHIEDFLSKDTKRKYREYFDLSAQDRVGNKTVLYIPSNHYAGKNMWLIKAINLNRGRCIKIHNTLDGIEKIIKHFYQGVFRNFKESVKEDEEEEVKVKEEKKLIHLPKIKIVNKQDNTTRVKSPNKINYSICNLKLGKKKYQSSNVIIQKYIEKPLLYKGRKFDMRIWVLLTHKMEVYAFREGHLKASSVNFDIESPNSFVHLTNYSVQKYNENFSKFEQGNEISFQDFQNELDKENKANNTNHTIKDELFPKVCEIIKLTMLSIKDKINPFERKCCFEIFGYDFIFDQDYNAFLLEVNTNPGLEISSSLISCLVPRMIDDAMRLTIDEIFTTEYLNKGLGVKYNSAFPIKGYTNEENVFMKVCDMIPEDDGKKKK